jgi:hypothetical protein
MRLDGTDVLSAAMFSGRLAGILRNFTMLQRSFSLFLPLLCFLLKGVPGPNDRIGYPRQCFSRVVLGKNVFGLCEG